MGSDGWGAGRGRAGAGGGVAGDGPREGQRGADRGAGAVPRSRSRATCPWHVFTRLCVKPQWAGEELKIREETAAVWRGGGGPGQAAVPGLRGSV